MPSPKFSAGEFSVDNLSMEEAIDLLKEKKGMCKTVINQDGSQVNVI